VKKIPRIPHRTSVAYLVAWYNHEGDFTGVDIYSEEHPTSHPMSGRFLSVVLARANGSTYGSARARLGRRLLEAAGISPQLLKERLRAHGLRRSVG